MAQKRRLFQKDNNGDLQEQLIASSADIVQIKKISGINATNVQDALEEIKTLADTGGVTSVNGKKGAVTLSKSDIGLGNVTNEAQIPLSQKGANGGVATLDSKGKIPESQLPSYVDDVLEFEHEELFPDEGEGGKIYVDAYMNKSYRWSGSNYVEISSSLALGETSSTAYSGLKGKANADAIAALQNKMNGAEHLIGEIVSAIDEMSDFAAGAVKGENVIIGKARQLATARTFSFSGDVSGSGNFDGSENVSITLKMPNIMSEGTYSVVSVDAKGRVNSGGQLIEWGTSGQTEPSDDLVVGGLFFELV